jgi:Cache domain
MPSRAPSINRRVLTVLLIAAVPILALGASYVVANGQARVRDAESVQLAQVAEYIARSADAYVFRRIVDAAVLARAMDIRRVAADGSRQAMDQRRVETLDQQWQQNRQAPAALAGVLSNAASRFLADVAKQDPLYREILVTDRHGRLVAASQLTTDYYQADEGWWTQALDDGRRGRIFVSDVRFDDSAGVHAFDIAVPIVAPDSPGSPDSGDLVGVMKIVASSQEMLAGIEGLQLGSTGHAMLIREDGSTVYSRQAQSPGARFFAADQVRTRLAAAASDPTARIHFLAPTPDGTERIVAVARSQLHQSFPNLNWIVAVSMAESELLQPFQPMVWSMMGVIGLTALAVLAVALWASMRLARPAVDPDLDLHLVEHAKVQRLEGSE